MVGLGAALLRATEGWRLGEEETRALQDRERANAERELRLQALRDQMSSQQEMRPLQMEQARLGLGEARRRNTLGGIEDEYRMEAMPEVYALEGRKRTSLGKTLDAQENVRTKYGSRGGVIGDYGSMDPNAAAAWELRDAQMRRELDARIREARTAQARNRAIQDKQNWIKLATLRAENMPSNLEDYALGRKDALARMRELADASTTRSLTPEEQDEFTGYQTAEDEYTGFLAAQEETRAQARWARKKLIQEAGGDPEGLDLDPAGVEDRGYEDSEDAMAIVDDPNLFDPVAPKPKPKARTPLADRKPTARKDKPVPLGEALKNARRPPATAPTSTYDRVRDFFGLGR